MRKRTFLLLISLLFIPILSFAQDWHLEYDAHVERAKELQENKKYEEAISLLTSAKKLADEYADTLRILESGIDLADVLYNNNNFEKSETLLLSLEELTNVKKWSDYLPEIKLLLGSVYYFLGDYELSAQEYELGYMSSNPSKNADISAQLSMNLANGLIRFGEYDKALKMITESISLFSSLDNQYFISRTNFMKYNIYLYKGEQDVGEPYLFEAFRIATELADPKLLRDCYHFMSDFFQRKNNYSQSILYAEKGLQVAEQLGDAFYIVRFYNELGEMYLEIEEPDRALSYFNRAHSYYVSVDNEYLTYDALTRIAQCYIKKGDFKQGEALLLKALTFYRNSNYHYDKGFTLSNLADLNIRVNNQKDARGYLLELMELGKEKNLIRLQLWAQERLLLLDESYFSKEQKLGISKQFYATASKLSPNYHLNSLKSLAIAYSELKSDSAFYYAELALEMIERKRVSFSGGTLKANLFSDYAPFYNATGSWYASMKKDYTRAFELFEASKSRALLDQLAESQSNNLLALSEETQIHLLQLQKTSDQLYRQREAATSEEEIIRLSDEITDAELSYEAALEGIRSKHPQWSSFVYPNTLSLKETQKLIDSNTGILEYALINGGLAILFITKNDVFYHEIDNQPFFRDSLTAQINTFRESIIQLEPTSVLGKASSKLYASLLEPFEAHLTTISNLVIIPDGSIALLPFDALLHNNEFLLNRFAIKYLPSVSVFKLLQNPHRATSQELLAVAGSGFESGKKYLGSSTQNNFAALPFTLIEVDSVSSRFEKTKVLKNESVSEASIKSLPLGTFKYIHFATHGDINETTPTQSGLILSKKTEMESLFGEDGYLNATEISALKLNADMVVLSACNTAAGKVLNGEGLLGLQRSFFVAGASSVVASLWSIYDRSTPLIMTAFYTNLLEYEDKEFGWFDQFLVWSNLYEPELVDYKTLALRDAKLEMLNHPYYSHPAHWASFIITGK